MANLLTQVRYGGAVAAVGLAGGSGLKTTVLPFLLRGVSLLGIDSVMCPAPRRQRVWDRLSEILPTDRLDAMTEMRDWHDLPALGAAILKGQLRGRTVVRVTGD